MTKKIATFQKELGSGITPSMPELRVPFFIDGQNIRFGAQGAEVTSPWYRLLNKLTKDPVRGMFAAAVNEKKMLFWGTYSDLFIWDGVANTAEQAGIGFDGVEPGTALQEVTVWTFAKLGQLVVATNNRDAPQKSVGGTKFKVFEGLENEYSRARILRPFGDRFVAFGLGKSVGRGQTAGRSSIVGDDVFAWSDNSNVEDWEPTRQNTAGFLEVADAAGPILAAEALGPSGMLFYTGGSIHNLISAGSVFILGQRRVLEGIGAASRLSVVPVGQKHYVFDASGIYVTDGREFYYIDDPAIRKHIYSKLNLEQISHVFGWHNRSAREVQWFYPTADLGMEGIGYNYGNGAWSLYPYELTSAVGIGVHNFPIAGNSFGSIFDADPNFLGGGTEFGSALITDPDFRLRTGYGTFGYGQLGFGGIFSEEG